MAKFTDQIIPVNASYSALIQESGKNSAGVSTFECPPNTVITGRWHQGDENGNTQYQYSELIAGALICFYDETETSSEIQESGKDNDGTSSFICPENAVIVGRCHTGDENGMTQYKYTTLSFGEKQMVTRNHVWSDWIVESGKNSGGSSTFNCPPNTVMTGREHQGDENGNTRYQFAELYLADTDSRVLLSRTTNTITSSSVKESAGTWVTAPENMAITGRQHHGDENGQTTYQFSYFYIKMPNNDIETINAIWSDWIKESDSNFSCPENTVMVGRQHKGDENGDTRYQYAFTRIGNSPNPCSITLVSTTDSIKESAGIWSKAQDAQVMTGRSHSGDENGDTTYSYSSIQNQLTLAPTNKTVDWMSHLSDSLSLSEINIPGTHDSAAFNRYTHTPYATQAMSITEQLSSGVRMLDVRLRIDPAGNNGFTFYTCHSANGSWFHLNYYQSFESLLIEVQAYILKYPSEGVIMSLKVDDWTSISTDEQKNQALNALASILSGYDTIMPDRIPNLGELRGNMYLLNRINRSYNLGVPIGWDENTVGYDLFSNGERENIRPFNVYVQDQYQNISTKGKLELFESTWNHQQSGELLINFASAVQNILMGVYINEPLLNNLGEFNANDRPQVKGISLFDYAAYPYKLSGDSKIIDCIAITIDSNFGYGYYPGTFQVKSLNKEEL